VVNLLLTPGPVHVPDRILSYQSEIIHHRSKEFSELYNRVMQKLEKFSGAKKAVVFTGSGTLANESMLSSLDFGKVLVVSNGVFGKRVGEISELYNNTEVINFVEGTGINYSRIKEKIDLETFDTLALVENETSTACINDVESIRKNFSGKLLVDSVSAWPVGKVSSESADIFTTASQKAIGIMPGLSIVFLNKKTALEVVEKGVKKNYYPNLKHNLEKALHNQNPSTPAVTLFQNLELSLLMIEEKGIDNFRKEHEEMSFYVRKKLSEAGFEIMGEKGFYSPTIVGFLCKSIEEKNRIKNTLAKKGFAIASGKGKYSEKGLRIGTMGFFEKEKIKECIEEIQNSCY